jgi:3-oxoadipate enol-lactonase
MLHRHRSLWDRLRRFRIPGMLVRSGDADIFYESQGDGAPVVLLHPFPIHHGFWQQVSQILSAQYRLILPDLRGLGVSAPGEGPATMDKHAEDLRRVCDDARVGKAVFVGVSIGGYLLFEFWRRYRDRALGLAFCNTRAGAETDEGKKGRLEAAQKIEERGTEQFVDGLIPRLIGETTRRNRPDIVDEARRMALVSTGKGLIANQLGMAERPDSMPTLATITVPTLFIGGTEDVGAPPSEIERMHAGVRGSKMRMIQNAGHYAAMERPEEFAEILREFLVVLQHTG